MLKVMNTLRLTGRQMTLIILFLLVVIGSIVYGVQGLSSTYSYNEIVNDTTIAITFDPGMVMLPGQAVEISWDIRGIKEAYLDGSGRIGTDTATFTIDHCTTLDWELTLMDDAPHAFSVGPRVLWTDGVILLMMIAACGLVAIAGNDHHLLRLLLLLAGVFTIFAGYSMMPVSCHFLTADAVQPIIYGLYGVNIVALGIFVMISWGAPQHLRNHHAWQIAISTAVLYVLLGPGRSTLLNLFGEIPWFVSFVPLTISLIVMTNLLRAEIFAYRLRLGIVLALVICAVVVNSQILETNKSPLVQHENNSAQALNSELFHDVIVYVSEHYEGWYYIHPPQPDDVIQKLWQLRWGGVIARQEDYDPVLTDAQEAYLQTLPYETVLGIRGESLNFVQADDTGAPGILRLWRYEDAFWLVPESRFPEQDAP